MPSVSPPNAARAKSKSERRAFERFDLDNIDGVIRHKGRSIPCEVVDISLEGCCARIQSPFREGALEYVELHMRLFNQSLEIGGITQWIRKGQLVGIRFIHPNYRSRNEMAALLTCLADREASQEIQAVIAEARAHGDALSVGKAQNQKPAEAMKPHPKKVLHQEVSQQQSSNRHEVLSDDDAALLHFVNGGSLLKGTIDGLSMNGCRIRLDKPYRGEYSTRIEVEFAIRGLHFRIGGVTQPANDPHSMNICFLEMPERRRNELVQALNELESLAMKTPESQAPREAGLSDPAAAAPKD